jgi:hypothetical protein
VCHQERIEIHSIASSSCHQVFDSLLKNVTSHPNLSKFYTEQLQLLKKSVPYDYVDSVEHFSETQLSPKEAFYSN